MDIAATISANLSAWMAADPSLDTVQKVEAKSGLGFGTVRRAKNGDGNITVEKLEKLASAFGRTSAELLTPPDNGLKLLRDDKPENKDSISETEAQRLHDEAVQSEAKALARHAAEVASLWMELPTEMRNDFMKTLQDRVFEERRKTPKFKIIKAPTKRPNRAKTTPEDIAKHGS